MKAAALLKVTAVLALIALDGWALWNWRTRREEAAEAAAQLAACQRMAARIERLRQAPQEVEEGLRSHESIARLVESAAGQSGLGAERIVHVAPGAPRPVPDSPYTEQATEVELREVTLPQLVELTQALRGAAPGVRVPSLALRTPPHDRSVELGAGQPETWNAQLTLTSHVYVPKIPAAR